MLLRRLLFPLLLLCALGAHATVSVTATLTDASGNPVPIAFLRFELANCGYNLPRVPSVSDVLVIKSIDFKPSQLPATIFGNDEITCGGVANVTRWHVTAYSNSTTKIAGDADYVINAAGGAWNLATATPTSATAPTPGFIALFANPDGSQTWAQPTGSSAIFTGVFDFTGATLLGVSGSGTNSTCLSSGGALGRFATTGTTVTCDPGLFSDGAGALTVLKLNGVRFADQFSGATPADKINNAAIDCGSFTGAAGNSCIVWVPSTLGCGGSENQTTDNVIKWDFRNCAQSQGLRFNLSAGVTGNVRSKMFLQDNYNANTINLAPGKSAATFYALSFVDRPELTNGTIAAINGTVSVNSQQGNFTGNLIGGEFTASAGATNGSPQTLSAMTGLLGNAGIGGNTNVTSIRAVWAQAVANSGTGTIGTAIGLLADTQTAGPDFAHNLSIWARGQVLFDGTFGIGASPVASTALLINSGVLTSANQYGLQSAPRTSSAATAEGAAFIGRADLQSAFTQTLNTGLHIQTPTLNGGTITEYNAIKIDPPPAAGTKWGIKSSDTSLPFLMGGGISLGPQVFASLGTPGDGRFQYCSDCTQTTVCAGGGTGALAQRINGAWSCSGGGATTFGALSGNIAMSQINSGTGASNTTFLRGDNQWVTPAGGGDISSAPGGAQTITQPAGTEYSVNALNKSRYCLVPTFYASLGACLSDVPTGGTAYLAPGPTTACNQSSAANNIHIVGSNYDGSTLTCGTAGQPVLTLTGSGGTIEHMTIKHTVLPTCAGGPGTATCGDGLQIKGDRWTVNDVHTNFNWNGTIFTGSISWAKYLNSISERNELHGLMYLATNTLGQLQVVHNLLEQNKGAGLWAENSTGSQGTCPHVKDNAMYGNVMGGAVFTINGVAGSGLGDCQFQDNIVSKNDTVGLKLDTGGGGLGGGGRNHTISGNYVENTGNGGGSTIAAGYAGSNIVWSNSAQGMWVTTRNDPTGPANFSNNTCWQDSNACIYAESMVVANDTTCWEEGWGDGTTPPAGNNNLACVTIRASNSQINGMKADGNGSKGTVGFNISNNADKIGISGVSCGPNITTANCRTRDTEPANYTWTIIGTSAIFVSNSGAPGGACQNGDEWRRTASGATGTTVWYCQNNLYAAAN